MKFACIVPCFILLASAVLRADVNVLIIGSDTPGDQDYATKLGNSPTPAFQYEEMADHFRKILEGAGLGTVNVTTRERYAGGHSNDLYSSNLATWFYWPFEEWEGIDDVGGWFTSSDNKDIDRWAELRGESGTQWDYIVLIGDPFTIETIPGYYTLGVSKIAEEVSKGTAETVLLMPWPAEGASSSLNHYREVVYRTGRTIGVPVAPGGLAWEAAGAPVGATHPSIDGAYIAAAALYGRLFGVSASASDYLYNDSLADIAYSTVTANQGAIQYTGPFQFTNPFKMLGDKRRDVIHSNRGTSTENGIRRRLDTTLIRLNISDSWTRDTYNSNTPDDDGLGWPTGYELPISLNYGRHRASAGDGSTKSYFTNRDYWQLGFGFAYQFDSQNEWYIGRIAERDLSLAYLMSEGTTSAYSYNLDSYSQAEEIASARLIPLHTLWAVIGREFPDVWFKRDNTHLNYALDRAASTFMYTLYSARTPVDDVAVGDEFVPDPDLNLYSQRIGYEMAWILGNVQGRAPGFKVKPASFDLAPSSETMSVRFLFPPQENVNVTISVSDPSLAEVTRETIVFTPENYADPVHVTARAKQRDNGSDQNYTVRFMTASNDEVFDNLSDAWEFALPSNASPSVAITSPADGASFSAGTDLNVTVDSSDPDGSVQSVTLWLNDSLVRVDTTTPYEWSVDLGDGILGNLSDDIYEIKVTAIDNQGESFTRTSEITVGSPSTVPPSIPGGLAITPAYGSVSLDWDDNPEGDLQFYSVYRSSTSGVYGDALAKNLTTSNYLDKSVTNGDTYHYIVTATDIYSNESAWSIELEAVPQEGSNAIIFGSNNAGLGGFTQSSLNSSEESWSLEPESVRYINDDIGEIDDGNDGGTKNGSLLREIPLNRSPGSSYTIEGIVNLTDGYGDDNNRVGIYLFGDQLDINSVGDNEVGALGLLLNTDTNTLTVTEGLNGTTISSANKVGPLLSDDLFGTELVFTADIEFTQSGQIAVTFTLRDADFYETTVTTQVAAAAFTGDYFGFVTRARTRGVSSSNRVSTWTMDYKSFRVTDTAAPAPPTGVAVSIGDGVILLHWEGSGESDLASYRVYRGTASGAYGVSPLVDDLTTSSYTDTAPVEGTTYYYVVTALDNSSNESGYSEELSITYYAEDSELDSDGDGIPDADELLAGSNPNDAGSRFEVHKATPQNGGAFAFEVSINPDSYYRVLYSDSLRSDDWHVMEGYENIKGSAGPLLIESNPTTAPRFYRVDVSAEPW